MQITTLRRGTDTKVVFTLAHTVVLNYDGRRLPCTAKDAQGVFDGNKKLRMVQVTDSTAIHYYFEDGENRRYDLYTQRL